MQIHELTRSRRVNEGFGSALAGQLMTKALGVNPLDQSGPAQSREQGFQSMVNSPAAKTLATTMQAAWAQTVKNFLANAKDAMGNPATSLKAVTAPSTSALQNELRVLVNKMIGGRTAGFDYANMANNIEDPVTKAGIQEVIARINEYTKSIFDATVMGIEPQKLTNDWIQLVGNGILPAQNAKAYDKNITTSTKPRFGEDSAGRVIISIGGGAWELFLPKENPKHKEIADQMAAGRL